MNKWFSIVFVGCVSSAAYAGLDETVVRQHMVVLDHYLSASTENNELISAIKKCEDGLKDVDMDRPCAHIYTSQDGIERIIELCKPSGAFKTGLYIQVDRKSSFKHYSWFDSNFMQWACSEIGSTDDATYLGVRNGEAGPYDAVIYSYSINLSAGYYYIKLNSDGTAKILDQQSSDMD